MVVSTTLTGAVNDASRAPSRAPSRPQIADPTTTPTTAMSDTENEYSDGGPFPGVKYFQCTSCRRWHRCNKPRPDTENSSSGSSSQQPKRLSRQERRQRERAKQARQRRAQRREVQRHTHSAQDVDELAQSRVPNAPGRPLLTCQGGRVVATCEAPRGAEQLEFKWRQVGSQEWQRVSVSSSTPQTELEGDFHPGQSYVVRVRALNASGTGDWSMQSVFRQPARQRVPKKSKARKMTQAPKHKKKSRKEKRRERRKLREQQRASRPKPSVPESSTEPSTPEQHTSESSTPESTSSEPHTPSPTRFTLSPVLPACALPFFPTLDSLASSWERDV